MTLPFSMKWFLLVFLVGTVLSEDCSRRPYEARADKKPGNNGYVIEIAASSAQSDDGQKGFIPGVTYQLSIRGWRTEYTVQTFRGFVLTAHTENGKAAGKFEIVKGSGDGRIAPGCRMGGVPHSNLRPKTSVHVKWRAPDVSTDCILIRASVIESKYIWYSDESQLTRKICIKEGHKEIVPQDDSNSKCCACDTAKYELEFIGLWSKETHPKEFPTCK